MVELEKPWMLTSAYIVEKIQGFEREIKGFRAGGAEGLTAPQAVVL